MAAASRYLCPEHGGCVAANTVIPVCLDEKEDYKRVLNNGIKTVMALCIPSTMILMVLNREIMQILFKWGYMSEYEAAMNGLALLAYTLLCCFSPLWLF